MELNNCKKKFKELFALFYKEGFELSSYYSENLLKYLDNDPDKRAVKVVETPFFSDLVIHAILNIENASESVKIFIVEVMCIMLRNELQFSKLYYYTQGVEIAVLKIFMVDKNVRRKNSPALSLAGINYCMAQLSHPTGVQWAIKQRLWEKIIRPDIKPTKIDLGIHNLLSKMVWKFDEYNVEESLTEILTYVSDPIRKHVMQDFTTFKIVLLETEEEKRNYEPIITSLKLLIAVISDKENITRTNMVVPLLLNHLQIKAALKILLTAIRHSDSAFLIGQAIFVFNFACTMWKDLNRGEEIDVSSESVITYCNVASNLLEKRLMQAHMQFSVSCFMFWTKLDKRVPSVFERHGRTFDIKNQFLLVIISPLIHYIISVYKNRKPKKSYIDAFFYKLTSLLTEHIIKNAYFLKDIYEESDCLKEKSIEATKQLLKLTNCLSESQAGIVYQSMFYILESYVVTDENGILTVGENPAKCPDDIKLISLALDLIKILLKEHDIKWYDSVEIISLQNCLMNLLKQNLLPSKQLLQALELIDLSIKKFLSPDLALLIASRQGNTLNEIAVVTKVLIQHPDWEIRDSAFHLLLTCTNLAYIQYVPLQKLLQENELISLATHAALFDEETYAQTTALRVLAATTRIEQLWNQALMTQPNLCVQITNILRKNPEGSIRKEAANVLVKVYEQQKLSLAFTNCLFNVMVSAAIDDLHWEVQLTALNFWTKVIQNFLSHRGMIDGKFPPVTFCKQKRKIITLDEKTIQHQLVGIIKDLAATGCLKVLKECTNEESSIQVIEKAYSISKNLMSMLDFYKFGLVPESESENMVVVKDENVNIICNTDLTPSETVQNTVIDSILNTQQCDLIQNLFENQIGESGTSAIEENIMSYTINKWLDPNDFINYYKMTDYAAIIDAKKAWHAGPRSVEELLDEVLALGEVNKGFVDECE